jgi:hypothetical protein
LSTTSYVIWRKSFIQTLGSLLFDNGGHSLEKTSVGDFTYDDDRKGTDYKIEFLGIALKYD